MHTAVHFTVVLVHCTLANAIQCSIAIACPFICHTHTDDRHTDSANLRDIVRFTNFVYVVLSVMLHWDCG